MTFGRKQTVDGAALAERRAAFFAAERARAAQRPETAHPYPAYAPEKSVATAYLLWFFLGGLSVHRFYLGFPVSGAIQASLLPISWALVVSGSLAAFLTFAAGGIWILADAFLIPGLQKQANARIRRDGAAQVFA